MSFSPGLTACLVLALLVGGEAAPPTGPAHTGQLRGGMTRDEVRQILGPPQRMARQILYHRYLEQWVYDAPVSVRLEFDCAQGQPARLIPDSTVDSDRVP